MANAPGTTWGKLPKDWEIHHIIPEGLADHPTLRNFDVQQFMNGIPLKKYSPVRNLLDSQHARHDQYTEYVRKRLDAFTNSNSVELSQNLQKLRRRLNPTYCCSK